MIVLLPFLSLPLCSLPFSLPILVLVDSFFILFDSFFFLFLCLCLLHLCLLHFVSLSSLMKDVTFCNRLTLLLLFKDCLKCLKSENIRSVDQFYIDSLPISNTSHTLVFKSLIGTFTELIQFGSNNFLVCTVL